MIICILNYTYIPYCHVGNNGPIYHCHTPPSYSLQQTHSFFHFSSMVATSSKEVGNKQKPSHSISKCVSKKEKCNYSNFAFGVKHVNKINK